MLLSFLCQRHLAFAIIALILAVVYVSGDQLQQFTNNDWRNRLIKRTTTGGDIIDIAYDGNGDRYSKTVNGVTTYYQIDRNNLTGYAQVVEEINEFQEVEVVYLYGLDLISQDRYAQTGWSQSFHHYDGLGTVRALSDATGSVTDEYQYDAYRVILARSGTTQNAYQYTGEQWDEDLQMYFLRARYMNPATGRFHTMDTFEGKRTDPQSLHKYLYVHGNPVMGVDPSGMAKLQELAIASLLLPSLAVHAGLAIGSLFQQKWFYIAVGDVYTMSQNDPEGNIDFEYYRGDYLSYFIALSLAHYTAGQARHMGYRTFIDPSATSYDITRALSMPNVKGFVFFGHGSGDKGVWACDSFLDITELPEGKKYDHVAIHACDSHALRESFDTKQFYGYLGFSYVNQWAVSVYSGIHLMNTKY